MDLKIKNDKDTKQNVKVKSGVIKSGILKKVFNKKVIAVICAIAVAGGGFTVYKVKTGAKKNTQSSRVRYTSLSKTNLYKMVSSSGAIKSGTSTSIYSNLNDYNVQQINVEVGDEVKKGDVLAIIDTSTLEDDIEKQELSVSANEKKAQIALEQAKDTYENAQSDYDKSQIALSAAKVSVEQEIEKNKKSYESAQAAVDDTSSRLALEKQKEKLKDKEVVATVDGIVTAVNASVGSKCEDSLFVIQDLNDLIVKVSVDETEIANVAVGQKVQVTTDASSEILEGEVVTVDPISSAAASETSTSSSSSSSSKSSGTSSTSSNSTSSDVTFTVKVQITSEDIDKAVKVGMNAVVNIIIGESDDVFAVPYESIIDNHGQKSIYEAEEQNGQYVVKEISVTTGLESDMNTEIEGEDLKEGMIVLNDPSNYHVGSVVDINNGR